MLEMPEWRWERGKRAFGGKRGKLVKFRVSRQSFSGRAEMLSRQLVQSQSALIRLGRMMSNEAIMQIADADSMPERPGREAAALPLRHKRIGPY